MCTFNWSLKDSSLCPCVNAACPGRSYGAFIWERVLYHPVIRPKVNDKGKACTAELSRLRQAGFEGDSAHGNMACDMALMDQRQWALSHHWGDVEKNVLPCMECTNTCVLDI